jgi:hypothetical protein
MDEKEPGEGSMYRIRIKGTIDISFADWLGSINLIPQGHSETLLVGRFADQPALRGFMDQLWNLNFTVLYLERIENEAAE